MLMETTPGFDIDKRSYYLGVIDVALDCLETLEVDEDYVVTGEVEVAVVKVALCLFRERVLQGTHLRDLPEPVL